MDKAPNGRLARLLKTLPGSASRLAWWLAVYAAILVLFGHLICELSGQYSWLGWPWKVPLIRYPAIVVDIIFLTSHAPHVVRHLRDAFEDLLRAE